MTDKESLLDNILEAMLVDNVTISARAVIRRSEGVFKHPTDVTRNERRRASVENHMARQATIRSSIERSTKSSRAEL